MEKKQQESKPSELSKSQEDSSSSSNLIEQVHQVKGTPFTLVYAREQYHICIGNQVVGDKPFQTIPQAETYIKSKPWQLILTAGYIYGKLVEQKLQEKPAEDKHA